MQMNFSVMEQWKDIENYEGLYQISNYGRVKSLERYRKGKNNSLVLVKERILKQFKDNNGYLLVSLYKNGKEKMKLVHRLVAEAFLPNPSNLPQVNHIDEDKTNNVDNLEWCDAKYNLNFGTRTKRASATLTNREDLSKQVFQYSLDNQLIAIYPSINEAARQNNCYKGGISNCCRGGYNYRGKWYNRETYKGFKWQYN